MCRYEHIAHLITLTLTVTKSHIRKTYNYTIVAQIQNWYGTDLYTHQAYGMSALFMSIIKSCMGNHIV